MTADRAGRAVGDQWREAGGLADPATRGAMLSESLAGQRIAVVGAGGFLGTNLLRALAAAGAHPIGVGRRPRFPGAIEGVPFQELDASDGDVLARTLDGADAAVLLSGGASPAASHADIPGDARDHLAGGVCTLDACAKAGVGRVVYVSSGGTVYGPNVQTPTRESAATEPISAYGVAKLALEKYVGLYGRQGMNSVVLRVSNPFGSYQLPRRGQGLIAAVLARAIRGEPVIMYGDGSVVRDYVHVADVVGAILRSAVARDIPPVLNIGAGTGRSISEVIRAVETELHLAVHVEQHPARMVDVPVSVLDVSLASRSLGWSPLVSFGDGLREAHAWMVAEGLGEPPGVEHPAAGARVRSGRA